MPTMFHDFEKFNGDFRLLLQQEFIDRCRRNQSYSLRAFARSLDIEPSPLSAILRGKRPLTAKMRQRLGLALGLSLDKIHHFKDLQKPNLSEFQQITLDNYAIISDWYHYAILELIRVRTFKPNANYIAKSLHISQTEASIAIERLQRVGLLEIKKNGEWVDVTKNGFATNIVSDDLTGPASKKLQSQVLEMSLQALEEVPVHLRSHTSMTMAIDPQDLNEARKRIKKFRRELCAFLERKKQPTQVYQLGISLYPISKSEE